MTGRLVRFTVLVEAEFMAEEWAAEFGMDPLAEDEEDTRIRHDAEAATADRIKEYLLLGPHPLDVARVTTLRSVPIIAELVRDLVQMDLVGAIELDQWKAARTLVKVGTLP